MDLIGNSVDQSNHSSKLATPVHGATPIFDNSRKQDPRSEGNSNSQKQDAEVVILSLAVFFCQHLCSSFSVSFCDGCKDLMFTHLFETNPDPVDLGFQLILYN